jgi:hypothetical protein
MNRKILISVLACMPVIAMAQSDNAKQKPASSTPVAAPRDSASGLPTGKRQYAPLVIRKVSDDGVAAPRDAQSGQASGKVAEMKLTSAQPTITDNKKTTSSKGQDGSGQTRVAVGDVNGDGKADSSTQSGVASPRDSSTGMATGKRQHQSITITKEVGTTSPQK